MVYFHPRQTDTYFFTATILKWLPLLQPDRYKTIVLESLKFLCAENRVRVLAFVIMPNHLHLVWQTQSPHTLEAVQRDFLKFTSQQMLFRLHDERPDALSHFLVNAKDRRHQIWQRGALSIPIYSDWVMEQKIRYIHNNPVIKKWKLAETPEEYRFSSARFYLCGDQTHRFLTDFRQW